MFRRALITASTRKYHLARSKTCIFALCSASVVLAPPLALANQFTSTTQHATFHTRTKVMNEINLDVWNGSDDEAFQRLDHPGYSLDSDPATFLGGWHAHRAVWETPGEDGTIPACWIKDEVMDMITKFDYKSLSIGRAPRILVLYGSLRPTSFSRKCAYEFARLLDLLGCDVRVYNPRGLPVRDPSLEMEPKVQELRALTLWR